MFVLSWAIALIMILKELNFEVWPLVTGAGVIGVAVGFGAQSVIKDILSGLFLLIENQIRVNDVAVINGKRRPGGRDQSPHHGAARRGRRGAHFSPTAPSKALQPTREYSYYMFNLSVDYKENTDHVIQVLKADRGSIAVAKNRTTPSILAPLEVMGVDQLGDFAVVIKARFKTLPGQQWLIGREMNRRIKLRFEEAQIEMPFPTSTIHIVP